MKHLLIVYHTQTGNTQRMAEAAYAGSQDDEVTGVEARKLSCADAAIRRDDALLALLLRQTQQTVQRTPLLERRGELLILELEEHIGASDLGKRYRPRARRRANVARDAFACGLNVGQIHPTSILTRVLADEFT